MKMRTYGFGLILLAQFAFAAPVFAADVVVYGLEAMPMSGVVDGKPAGITVDILNEATKHGAPSFEFRFNVPWARAQEQIQQAGSEISAIIPFSRSAQREGKFKWVAELVTTQYRFFSYGRPAPLKSIDEAKNVTVGVVRGHAILPVLKQMGLTKLDEGSPAADSNATKLLNKRYDTIADSDVIALYNWKKIGQKTSDLQVGPAIGDTTRVYIAGGLIFPDDVAKRIYDAVETMRKNGKLKEILNKWL